MKKAKTEDENDDLRPEYDLATLKGGGQNRVLSYLNVGSCESYRDYYAQAPAGDL